MFLMFCFRFSLFPFFLLYRGNLFVLLFSLFPTFGREQGPRARLFGLVPSHLFTFNPAPNGLGLRLKPHGHSLFQKGQWQSGRDTNKE